MLRLGTWTREQLQGQSRTFLGARREIAYNLLCLRDGITADGIRVFDETMSILRLSSGVFRTTYRERFQDLNAVAGQIMSSLFPRDCEISVHDWAASSGLTSVEWARDLFLNFPSLTFTASDYFFALVQATNRRGETYIFEPDGTAIQYIRPPFVVPLAAPEKKFFILNQAAIAWSRRAVAELSACVRSLEWESVSDGRQQVRGDWRFEQIDLVHPEARALAEETRHFEIVHHDAFCHLRRPCNVLRVMNFYNPETWDAAALGRGFQAAFESVSNRGLLILGRTQTQTNKNHVSIFQRVDDELILIERLGSGFEMEDSVLGSLTAKR